MSNILSLCFISFLIGGLVGISAILFVQGAFNGEYEEEKKQS